MSSGTRILYGIFLFVPIIMIILIEVETFSHLDEGRYGGILRAMQHAPDGTIARILLFLGIAVLCNLVALVINMVHLMRNPSITDSNRLPWILILLLTGIIGQLIYFFKFMARAKPQG